MEYLNSSNYVIEQLRAKEQIEHMKNTIGMEGTLEEKAMRLDFIEWAENQPVNLQKQDECSRADSV